MLARVQHLLKWGKFDDMELKGILKKNWELGL
jgi:hypothetical protein